jgi:hypothetical protein
MPAATAPIGRSPGAQVTTKPSIKQCLNATVQAADRLDDWIRRYVVEHPLRYRPSEFCADRTQSAGRVSAFSRISAPPVVRQSRVNPPPRDRAVLTPNRGAWLCAIGSTLKAQYDAAATPLPSRLAALVEQLEMQR